MGSFQKVKTFKLEVFGGDYKDVWTKLFELIQVFALHHKWQIKNQSSKMTVFNTPMSWASFGESVYLSYNFNSNELTIQCYTENGQLVSWGKLEKNVNTVIDFIGPRMQEWIKHEENKRQKKNKDIISEILTENSRLIENTSFTQKLKVIQELVEKSQLPNILKIFKYYSEQVHNHNILIENVSSVHFNKSKDYEIDYAKKSINVFSSLVYLLENAITVMLEKIVEQDLVEFYEIYNVFEDMGLFLTKGEKLVISEISDINENLGQIISGIDVLAIGMSGLSSKFNELTQKISDLNTSTRINSALNAVNTYQLYKINKKLSSS
jgi:hypothetical protein